MLTSVKHRVPGSIFSPLSIPVLARNGLILRLHKDRFIMDKYGKADGSLRFLSRTMFGRTYCFPHKSVWFTLGDHCFQYKSIILFLRSVSKLLQGGTEPHQINLCSVLACFGAMLGTNSKLPRQWLLLQQIRF